MIEIPLWLLIVLCVAAAPVALFTVFCVLGFIEGLADRALGRLERKGPRT